MSVPILTFFNNKGGVGKTSLVFHLSWMFSKMGLRVVAVDLDPQANLTSAFLDEDKLDQLWSDPLDARAPDTIYKCLTPLQKMGDLIAPETIRIKEGLFLIPGDLSLAGFEDNLSAEWLTALGDAKYRPMRILSAFWQVSQLAAQAHDADLIVIDVGPNLGAINRSALIATDHIVIPLAADLFSLQGLLNLGPTLRRWRAEWKIRRDSWIMPEFELPEGQMRPAGYVLMQHSEILKRPVKAYQKWIERIPSTYAKSVLDYSLPLPEGHDRLAGIKHYRSLVPMALEARKPIFELTSADGAIGSHLYAVKEAEYDFRELARKILAKIGIASSGEI